MGIISVLKNITTHPLNNKSKTKAFFRFVNWQLSLNPYPIIYPFTEKSKLIIKKGMAGATGNLYCGLHEYNDMGFLLHFLREEDTFADIGANIGSYTVLAAAHIGCKTISIEPVPLTFQHLLNNIAVNHIENKVTALNIALGAEKGSISFTNSFDTMNHVASDSDTSTIEVPIETLDNLILRDGNVPSLLKIDVEGFESSVIKGGINTLNKDELKAIIIELNGLGARYGYDERKVHDTLLDIGFQAYLYDPKERKLTCVDNFGTHNTIYIKDLNFVKDRVGSAPSVKILNQMI